MLNLNFIFHYARYTNPFTDQIPIQTYIVRVLILFKLKDKYIKSTDTRVFYLLSYLINACLKLH